MSVTTRAFVIHHLKVWKYSEVNPAPLMACYLESQLKLHDGVVKREVGGMKNVCKIGQFLLQGITHEGMPGIPIVLVCS